MTLVPARLKDVSDSGTRPGGAIAADSHRQCDPIRGEKPDAIDIARQTVRIVGYSGNTLVTISLVDLDRKKSADSVSLEKDHDIANRTVFPPGGLNILEFPIRDSGNIQQFVDLIFEYFQRPLTKVLNDSLCRFRPHSLNQTGA